MKKLIIFLFIFTASVYSDWSKINSFPNAYVGDIFIAGNTVYAVSINSGVYRSTDGTASWQQLNNGLNNPQAIQCQQIIQAGSNLFTATVDGIYFSTDEGANWIRKSEGILHGSGATYIFTESIWEHNGVLFTGAYSGIFRSTNGGENWLTTNVTGLQHVWAKNFTVHDGIIFAARESINNPVGYKSTDDGLTWQNITFQYPTITFFSEPGKLFAGTIHGAWLSTNNGINWVNRSNGLSADPYNSSFLRINGTLVTSLKFGGSGIYRSFNDGVLWETWDQGLGFLSSIEEMVIFNNKILLATSNGIYERNISELTGITHVSSEIPWKFSLEQNYPNPFNPETNIKFSIAAKNNIKISVFDVTGKEISVLIDMQLEPGTYEINFDASALTSGIYFYRLEADNFSETKRMILVK